LLAQECEPSVAGIRAGLIDWPGGSDAASRKLELFDDRVVGMALERLQTVRAHSQQADCR
jgi:hypothetical protein